MAPLCTREWTAFFLLGLFNNAPFVLFLSAAEAILPGESGAVLMASILPTFIVQVVSPFLDVAYPKRYLICGILAASSFYIVALVDNVWLRLVGVGVASFAGGWGESSTLAMLSYYNASSITAWASGTGFAGVVGAAWYLLLQDVISLSPVVTLQIGGVLPVMFLISYFVVLPKPPSNEAALLATDGTAPLVASSAAWDEGAGTSSALLSGSRSRVRVVRGTSASGVREVLLSSPHHHQHHHDDDDDDHYHHHRHGYDDDDDDDDEGVVGILPAARPGPISFASPSLTGGRESGVVLTDSSADGSPYLHIVDAGTAAPSAAAAVAASTVASHAAVSSSAAALVPGSAVRPLTSDDDGDGGGRTDDVSARLTMRDRLAAMRPLAGTMAVLAAAYLGSYTSTTALVGVLSFPADGVPKHAFYVRAALAYQLGVFASRSSGSLLPVRVLWPLPTLLLTAAGFLVAQALLQVTSSWAVCAAAIFWVGLMSGATYVNAYAWIRERIDPALREFSLGAVTMANSFAIVVAAVIALAVEPALNAFRHAHHLPTA